MLAEVVEASAPAEAAGTTSADDIGAAPVTSSRQDVVNLCRMRRLAASDGPSRSSHNAASEGPNPRPSRRLIDSSYEKWLNEGLKQISKTVAVTRRTAGEARRKSPLAARRCLPCRAAPLA